MSEEENKVEKEKEVSEGISPHTHLKRERSKQYKHLWKSKKKDIDRILDKEGVIVNFRIQYLNFGKELLKKTEGA